MLPTLALAALVGATAAMAKPVQIVPRQNNNYPPILQIADPSYLPKEWTDALAAATAAGKIPDFPPSTTDANGATSYPDNLNSNQDLCSWTTSKCLGKHDIVNAPGGQIGVAFDDGPTQVSGDLYDFLQQNKQSATHFMIGSNVVQFQDQFQEAVKEGNQHFAVHTWSHNLMTGLTNEQILGELGWTMQAIADYSGGYIPKFWRPPQGDVDNRVRAIAEEIFGLYNVLWNHDTNDWCLNDQGGTACPGESPGESYDSVAQYVEPIINGDKSTGVIFLEHELSHASISIFKNHYPRLTGLGWAPNNIADLFKMDWYKNAADNSDTPSKASVIGPIYEDAPASSSSSSSSTSSSSTTSSSSSASATTTTSAAPSSTKGPTLVSLTGTSSLSAKAQASKPTGVTGSQKNGAAGIPMAGASLALSLFACVFAALL